MAASNGMWVKGLFAPAKNARAMALARTIKGFGKGLEVATGSSRKDLLWGITSATKDLKAALAAGK